MTTAQARLFFGYYEQGREYEDWEKMEEAETGRDAAAYEALKARLGVASAYGGNYGRRYLYIAQSYKSTIGEPIDPARLAATTRSEDWEARLREYARAVGMKFGRVKPRWWLVAYWAS